MQKRSKIEVVLLSKNISRLAVGLVLFLITALLTQHAHATDLLAGTMTDVSQTLTGTGKKWIILIDFAVSLGAFAMTKKPFVFFSTLGVLLAISGIGVIIQ